MNIFKTVNFFSCFIFTVILLSSCSSSDFFLYKLHGSTMGTTYHVKLVFAEAHSNAQVMEFKAKIQRSLDKIDELMSTYKPDSEISRFNRLKVGGGLTVSPETNEVITSAQKITSLSAGLFDVTVGPLIELWGFGSKTGKLIPPTQSQIDIIAQSIGSDHFELINGNLKKLKPSQMDLSAIAKGYAVDQVAVMLDKLGAPNYLIEVGGEIRAKGLNQYGKVWVLGIEQPDFLGRKAYTSLNLKNASMATSGDYRNFFEYEGKRYSHTINPKTFYPVQHQLSSVTVVSDSCMISDALATALMIMGEEKGYEFAVQNKIMAFFIFRVSEGFRSKSTPSFAALLN